MSIAFWVGLLVLNTLYFLPGYILDVTRSSFLPFLSGRQFRFTHLLRRQHPDIFRICTDLWIISFGYVLILKQFIPPGYFAIIFVAFSGITLVYQVYHTGFARLYRVTPVFLDDSFMLKNAFSIFIHEYDRKNVLITLGAVAIAIAVSFGAYRYAFILYARSVPAVWEVLLFLVLLMPAVYSMFRYSYEEYTSLVFQSPLLAIAQNMIRSLKARRRLDSLSIDRLKLYNPGPEEFLKKKPNIILVVVESYGRILYDYPAFRDDFLRDLKTLENRLADHQWHACSGFSTSPITGGASWLSYTSILYGLKVDSHSIFLSLLKNKRVSEYQSVFRWLKGQGYTTYRLSNLGGYENMKIPYAAYSRMFAIDEWITYRDLGYNGREYGFGPSPPDQYALWFANERIRHTGDDPFALFFITQNSHTPFDSPEHAVKDWRSLSNNGDGNVQPSLFWSKPDFRHYVKAIRYQLDYLTDFCCRACKHGDVVICIGDHQPPSLSIPMSSFDTPVHVLSKDKEFIGAFSEFGMQAGLTIPADNKPLRHEAIYSALRRALLKCYGGGDVVVPEFLPKGINLDT